MAGASETSTGDPRKITARMLDEAFVEAVSRPELAQEAINNGQAVIEDREPENHVIDGMGEGAGVVENNVIDEFGEEVTRWYRRAGRLFVNTAGNWERAGRLYSLEY